MGPGLEGWGGGDRVFQVKIFYGGWDGSGLMFCPRLSWLLTLLCLKKVYAGNVLFVIAKNNKTASE